MEDKVNDSSENIKNFKNHCFKGGKCAFQCPVSNRYSALSSESFALNSMVPIASYIHSNTPKGPVLAGTIGVASATIE